MGFIVNDTITNEFGQSVSGLYITCKWRCATRKEEGKEEDERFVRGLVHTFINKQAYLDGKKPLDSQIKSFPLAVEEVGGDYVELFYDKLKAEYTSTTDDL